MRRVIAVALAVLAAGCAAGPTYQRPVVVVPPSFKEEPPRAGPSTTGQWRAAQPADATRRGAWWEVYGDPVLNDLERQVATANQNIAEAEARFRGARAAVRLTRADLFPGVTVGATATTSYGARAGRVGAASTSTGSTATTSAVVPSTGRVTDYNLPIDFSYELDLWGRVRRNVEASVATAQATAADLASAQLSMESELASDYFQLRGLDAQRELFRTSVDAYERALQLTRSRHDQGVSSGVDVAQAETQLASLKVQAMETDLTRAQFEHAIAVLIGRPPSGFGVAPVSARVLPPPVPEAVPSQLLERRPDIAGAERRVAAANAQIGVAQAAFFPSIALSAAAGFQSTSFADWFTWPSRFWSFGPSALVTLFDGGRRRAATEQARANHEATVAVYRQSVLTAFQDVEDNLAACRILAAVTEQQAVATEAAERALSLAMARYRGGLTTYLEVITAQAAALSNERSSVDLMTRRMTASVQLVKALGGGW